MTLQSTLVTTAKNEGPYIWEWVAYHKMIGFDNILMFQNDSNDGTGKIMTALHKAGIIKYFYNEAERGKHQIRAYKRAANQALYQQSDWAMALDMDEFLVIRTGDGTVSSLLDALPKNTDCAFLCWKRFGTGHERKIREGLVSERFTLCEKDETIKTFLRPYKSLFKSKKFVRPGIHRPEPLANDATSLVYVNGSGLHQDQFRTKNFRCTDPSLRKLAQINHYITRDAQSFTLKVFKGSAHQSNRGIDQNYWRSHNRNQMEDLRIQRYGRKLHDEMERMDQKTNGALSQLTEQAVAIHQEMFKTVIQNNDMAELYKYCSSRPQVPLDLRK